MIDSHCHLDVASFDGDRDEVVARATAAGVTRIVVPAIRPSTWGALLEVCARFPVTRAALGIHPQVVPFLSAAEKERDLAHALDGAGAIAVGECGLDGATGAHEEQERLFAAQIAVARELGLPLLVHVLRAHDTAPRVMREARAHEVGGIMHSYSGPPELIPVYRDLGFAFSFAGPISYKNARKPVAAAQVVPLDLLLAETDAPDQAPEPHRGGRCEPAFVGAVVAGLARARGVSVDEMAEITSQNVLRVLPRMS